jgi:lipoprotein-releasing system ATP-binding protein
MSAPNAPLLELVEVAKTWPGAEGGEPVAVLRDVKLSLARGERIAITGPSGSGKSTLLNLIGALEAPSAGQILLEGRDLARLSEAERGRVRNEALGFIFQLHHLLPQCTALENVLTPTLACRDAALRKEAPERARHLLEQAGLGQRLHHPPAKLSGGERQRVAVARALINRPRLVLADEPTGALDRATAERVSELLFSFLEADGIALILVTHDPALAQAAGRGLRLEDGTLVSGAASA